MQVLWPSAIAHQIPESGRYRMTSVNPGQPTPYTIGYEMSPKPTPIRYQDSADAAAQPAAQADSVTPRSLMTSQQRGRFSSHSELVNSTPRETAASGPLAELKLQQDELRAQLKGVSDALGPLIEKLLAQVADLTQQLATSDRAPKETPVATTPQPEAQPAADLSVMPNETSPAHDVVAPETFATPDQVPTQQSTPQNLDHFIRENNAFHQTINGVFKQLSSFLEKLAEQIGQLAQQVSAMAGTQTPAPSQTADATEMVASEGVQPESPSNTQNNELNAEGEPAMPELSTVEEVRNQNELLRGQIAEKSESYKATISALEQQVEMLIKQVNDRKK